MMPGKQPCPAARRGWPIRAAIFSILTLMALGCRTGGEAVLIDDTPLQLGEAQDVAGQVVDRHGDPVKGAELYLYFNYGPRGFHDRIAGKTKSGSGGQFTFKEAVAWPESGAGEERDWGTPEYSVIASHPKHGIAFAILHEDDPPGEVTVKMYRAHTTTLKVKDNEGEPVEGALVYLNAAQLPAAHREGLARNKRYCSINKDIGISSGTTNAQGEVEVEMPYKARYIAEKEGYTRNYSSASKIDMFPSARVEGTVTFADGSPVAGALVEFDYSGERLGWGDATVTDDEGKYTFADVAATGYRYSWMEPNSQDGAKGQGEVKVTPADPESPYCAKVESFPCDPGNSITKDVVLEKGLIFAGKVIDVTTNQPAPNMRFNIYFETGGRYLDTRNMKTAEDGSFHTVVAPGSQMSAQWDEDREDNSYVIDEEWLRRNRQPFRGKVTEDMPDLQFEVKLWPVQPLSGRVVTASGDPVAGAEVHMHSDLSPIKVAEDGTFTLKTAPTDRDFELFAVSPEKDLAGLLSLKAGAAEATITLEPTKTYEGQATNTEGLPANNLSFYLDMKLNDSTLYRCREEPETDDEGRFTVEHLCPKATYYAWWSSDNDENRDYDYGNATINLTELAEGELITFEAKQYLNCMMGNVVDKEGKPIAGANIEILTHNLVRQDDRWNRPKPLVTDESGDFEIPLLAAGEAEVRISAEGYKSTRVKARTDAIDVKAVLGLASEGSDHVITIVDEDGKPLENVPVILYSFEIHEGAEKPEIKQVERRTDRKGEVHLHLDPPEDDKTPGGALLGLSKKGYTVAYRQLVPDEDSETTLTLRKKGDAWSARVLDEKDKPIAGAQVKVTGMRPGGASDHRSFVALRSQLGLPEYAYETDADGRFQLADFSRHDQISFTITADGYAQSSESFHPDHEEGQDRDFKLELGGQITGKVTIEGNPEVDWTLCHVSAQHPPSDYYSEKCEEDGTFRFGGTKPGEYKMMAGFGGKDLRKYVCQDRPTVEVKAGEVTEVNIDLVKGVLVQGRVVDKATGQPFEGRVSVSARHGEQDWAAGAGVEDDGTWEMYLFPGTFKLFCYVQAERQQKEMQEITIEEAKPVEDILLEVESKASTE